MSIHSTSLHKTSFSDSLLKCILTSKGCNSYLIDKKAFHSQKHSKESTDAENANYIGEKNNKNDVG